MYGKTERHVFREQSMYELREYPGGSGHFHMTERPCIRLTPVQVEVKEERR